VDQTIELESAQKLVIILMAGDLMDPAILGARIDVLGEIQRVFGGPDNIATL
jgi:hypothetical protein